MGMSRASLDTVTERSDRLAARWVPDILRWTAGLLWLSNASWKVPPDFGRSGGRCENLCRYMEDGVSHPVLPGSGWIFENLLTPNLFAFGWATVLIETALAAMFISGRYLRTAAVLGLLQSVGIGLAVANADDEWYWSYGLMIALHLGILFTAATSRLPSLRTTGFVVAGYGVLVVAAHRAAGLGGDENDVFSLFEQSNDFPGDFGRNVFPGSIAAGLGFLVIGAALAAASPRVDAAKLRVAGLTLAVASLLVLVFAAAPRVEGWLGLRPSSIAMVGVVALALIKPVSKDSNHRDAT